MDACHELDSSGIQPVFPCLPALVVRKDTELPGVAFFDKYGELYQEGREDRISGESDVTEKRDLVDGLQLACFSNMNASAWDALIDFLKNRFPY